MKAPFPNGAGLSISELLFLRSWQAEALVKFYYYIGLVVCLLIYIYHIVYWTYALGVGGFFLGFLLGLITFTFTLFMLRISSEVILSIFVIRDATDSAATNSGGHSVGGAAPSPNQGLSYQGGGASKPQQTYETL